MDASGEMKALVKNVTDEVTAAAIVKQAVSVPSGPIYRLVTRGGGSEIERSGSDSRFLVPDSWASALRLDGVLADGGLVISVPTEQGRRSYAIDELAQVRELAALEQTDAVTAAGNRLVIFGRAGLKVRNTETTEVTYGTSVRVAEASSNRAGDTIAFVTRPSPYQDALLWRTGTPAVPLVTGGPSVRPAKVASCGDGCHVSVLVRFPRDRQILVFETSRLEQIVVVEHASNIFAWTERCNLLHLDDHWPYARLHRTDPGGETLSAGYVRGATTRLLPSADGTHVHASSVDHPPSVLPLAEVLVEDDGSLPAAGTEVRTRNGTLRILRRRHRRGRSDRDVFLLHGGPYGLWTPCWDPIVDLLGRLSLEVHQLEAPYTAALQGRHAQFNSGDFGAVDAESVAEAITKVSAGSRLAPLILGHSYGGYLGARAAQLIPGRVGGLFLMSSIWQANDLARLRDDDRENRSPLSAFLAHAFPRGSAIPATHLPRHVPVHVVHGSRDPIVPVEFAVAATSAIPNATLTILPGEGHIPQRPAAVSSTLHDIANWVERTNNLVWSH
ncbi:alpha/beta fold hydrolase [Micromonospora violae]|uniref:alpha/beta fold hydrolase n=1 Tax=Micromonospora violae TaxID=1278207 RepID=UPI0033CBCCA2